MEQTVAFLTPLNEAQKRMLSEITEERAERNRRAAGGVVRQAPEHNRQEAVGIQPAAIPSDLAWGDQIENRSGPNWGTFPSYYYYDSQTCDGTDDIDYHFHYPIPSDRYWDLRWTTYSPQVYTYAWSRYGGELRGYSWRYDDAFMCVGDGMIYFVGGPMNFYNTTYLNR
jgi:hypothetical protein